MSGASHIPTRHTGFTDAQLGTLLFLAAETMFLGALASSLVFLRTAAEPAWPPAHTVLPAGAGLFTVFLAILFALIAFQAARRGTRAWLAGAALAALLPMAGALIEIARMAAMDHLPDRHNLFALHLLCAGLMALHALGGALWAGLAAGIGPTKDSAECFAWYAHFLAIWSMAQYALVYWI